MADNGAGVDLRNTSAPAKDVIMLSFGTAGMRGIMGDGEKNMNMRTVRLATRGLADLLISQKSQKGGVVIAYDTRRNSIDFALEAARVLSAAKIRVYIFEDVRPVPVCSFAVRHLNAAAGIMITASHNPKEYNGYKVYGADGAQLNLEDTQRVAMAIDEALMRKFPVSRLESRNIKGADKQWLNDYISVIGKSVDTAYFKEILRLPLSPQHIKQAAANLKIVYTPLHGSGRMPVITALKLLEIPFEVVKEQELPDPEFSTVSAPNPEDPKALSLGIAQAKAAGADLVMGTDPDCDRMGAAVKDDKGGFITLSGNQIGALIMDYILLRLKELEALPKNAAVVKTIVTTGLADKVAAHYGTKLFSVLTGFKFIGEKIKEWEKSGEFNFIFGYEESFGYLAGIHARDKDAVVACMLFAEAACYFKTLGLTLWQRLQQLYKTHGYFVEKNTNFDFTGTTARRECGAVTSRLRIADVQGAIGEKCVTVDYLKDDTGLPKSDVLKFNLADGAWAAVRGSGTEPKLKLYVSAPGKTQAAAKTRAEKLSAEFIKLMFPATAT